MKKSLLLKIVLGCTVVLSLMPCLTSFAQETRGSNYYLAARTYSDYGKGEYIYYGAPNYEDTMLLDVSFSYYDDCGVYRTNVQQTIGYDQNVKISLGVSQYYDKPISKAFSTVATAYINGYYLGRATDYYVN